jgi:hypothetical protein
VQEIDTVKARGFSCECPLCLSRIGDPRAARRMEIYVQLVRGFPTVPGLDVFEALFAEIQTLGPVSWELAVLAETYNKALEKAGRDAEATAALEQAIVASTDCGWMPDRRLRARSRLRQDRVSAEDFVEAVGADATQTWGVSRSISGHIMALVKGGVDPTPSSSSGCA